MLEEKDLGQLEKQHDKIGIIEWEGHQLVFRKPTRDDIRSYRLKVDNPAQKPDALDQLAGVAIIAFDGIQDAIRAREMFLLFLDEYPMWSAAPKVQNVFFQLTGAVEVEDEQNLGKGATVRRAHRKNTPKVLPNGPGVSPQAKS